MPLYFLIQGRFVVFSRREKKGLDLFFFFGTLV